MMKIKTFFLSFMAVVITACASAPTVVKVDETHLKLQDGHAAIYLYRGTTFKSGMAGIIGTIGHNNVTIDQKQRIELNNGEYYIIDLIPGKHELTWSLVIMGYEKDAEQIKLELAAGEWRLINFSEAEVSKPDANNLRNSLQGLEFMQRINLTGNSD